MTEIWHGPVRDQWQPAPLLDQQVVHRGGKWNVVLETAIISEQEVKRDIVVHPGAVAIVALDDSDRIFLIRQYRQAIGAYLFETPAGLLDDSAEEPLTAARRELVEEAGLEARNWEVLVDFLNSPGGSSEAIRIYLARDLTEAPQGRMHTGEAEEAELPGVWIDLGQAGELVLSGELNNPTTVVGVLAALVARRDNWSTLRPAHAPWEARDRLHEIGRLPLR